MALACSDDAHGARYQAGTRPGDDDARPPEGVTIRSYSGADERVLYELHQAAFAEHWGFHPVSFERWNELLHGEGWDPSLVFLADVDGASVGYLVGFLEETSGFVGMLGVLKEHRGRGIATALLRHSFLDFARRGRKDVRLASTRRTPTAPFASMNPSA